MNITNKILVVSILVIVSCKGKVNNLPFTSDKFEMGKLQLTDLSGKSIDLWQYHGKTVFINFWATWCKPCLQEMPSIQKLQGLLKNENIVFLFASEESAEQIVDFKSQYSYNFNYVSVQNMPDLNIMALPTTFIFNPAGNLVFNESGSRQWDDKNNIDLILSIIKSK